MPNNTGLECKRSYKAYGYYGYHDTHLFDIIKDQNGQLSVLYPNGKLHYGAEYKLLPTVNEAINNAIFYL